MRPEQGLGKGLHAVICPAYPAIAPHSPSLFACRIILCAVRSAPPCARGPLPRRGTPGKVETISEQPPQLAPAGVGLREDSTAAGSGEDGTPQHGALASPRPRRESWRVTQDASGAVGSLGQYSSLSSSSGSMGDLAAAVEYAQQATAAPPDDQDQRKVVVLG